jgi:micrococcal nuclease
MSTLPPVQPARKKRMPNWLKITLGVFVALFLISAIFGKPAAENPSSPSAAAPSTTTTTTTTAPPDTYTVAGMSTGDTVRLVQSGGVEKTVRVLGIIAPPSGTSGCFGAESVGWASGLLLGKTVTMGLEPARAGVDSTGRTLAHLTLPDGSDYASTALKAGYAKLATDAATLAAAAQLRAAEDVARTASIGLWGAPCHGAIDTPAPTITVEAPVPPGPEPTTVRPKATQKTVEPAPQPEETTTRNSGGGSVYYPNCAAARAAGAAPLYAGQPGYSRKLDRDGDGVACE